VYRLREYIAPDYPRIQAHKVAKRGYALGSSKGVKINLDQPFADCRWQFLNLGKQSLDSHFYERIVAEFNNMDIRCPLQVGFCDKFFCRAYDLVFVGDFRKRQYGP
jgi:hypothetical protein